MSVSSGTSQRIVRSTGTLAIATGVSRILGFIRDLLIAALFGTLPAAQAFVVAFRLPNLLRDVVAEGAMTSAVVPVLSWYRSKQDSGEFWHLSQALLVRLLVVLCAIGLIGVLAAPQIVRVIAPGFSEDPEKFALTVRLTRLLFPFIILVGLWAYFVALLNTLRHFAVPALGPAILNLSMIIACIWFVPRASPAILALAIGVMAGGIIQLLIQLPVASRHGFRWRWRWSHPGASEILRLLGPRMVGSAVYQINVLIHTALASLAFVVGEGAVAALYFANRLVQLPLALFGTASAQASLPSLSEQAAHGDWTGFRTTLLTVIRMVAFVMVPASVGLIVLAFPIVGGLFERGAFDHHSTIITSQAVICYSLGLVAYAISKVFSGAFYAMRDTATPVRLAAEAVAVNVVLSLGLMWPLQIMGLALSAALANTLNAYRLTRSMERRLGSPLIRPIAEPCFKILLASIVMGAGCFLIWRIGVLAARPLLGLPVVIVAGLILYAIACALLRIKEFSAMLRWINAPPIIQRFVKA